MLKVISVVKPSQWICISALCPNDEFDQQTFRFIYALEEPAYYSLVN